MEYNLAKLGAEAMEKLNVDLAAAGVAFRERYNMPVVAEQVEWEQRAHLRDYFRKRVVFYREVSLDFSRLPYEPHNIDDG